MYKLTDRMLQNLEANLRRFHELFQGGRCQAWQLEELIAKAIRSDFNKNEKVLWKGNGHDIGADILINDNVEIQIKSGKIEKGCLVLSGHRLGRFKENLERITEFLDKSSYMIIAVPYYTEDDQRGQSYNYQLCYFDTQFLRLGDFRKWKKEPDKKGREKEGYFAENEHGVRLSLHPSMSWQIWWRIPMDIIPENNKTRIVKII